MKKYKVYHQYLHPNDIFDLTDPAYTWRASLIVGKDWWDAKYDDLRKEIHDFYIRRMDELTNHYSLLRKSVEKQGFLNPVPVTCGPPQFRSNFVPPVYYQKKLPYVVEYMGGSRYLVAKEMNLELPCIISDFTGQVQGEELKTEKDIQSKLHDKTIKVHFLPEGVRLKMSQYDHIPDKKYTSSVQSQRRGIVIKEIEQLTKRYLKKKGR